nr:MAG TPA: hypothetical protein [Caudoviricetes sp.]
MIRLSPGAGLSARPEYDGKRLCFYAQIRRPRA